MPTDLQASGSALRDKGMTQHHLLMWYRGAVPPDRKTPLEIVMIQATPFCNINCSYCYLPHRTQKGLFDLDQLPGFFHKLTSASLLGRTLSIVWHAGEPFVLPISYYETADDKVREAIGARSAITHHFQTNGTLLTQAHCDVIKKRGFRIGLSIDGPADVHDRNRVHRSGKGTHAEAMRAVELLHKNGIPFNVIAVLSAGSLEDPDRMFDFFEGLRPTEVGFNVEEIENFNKTSSLADPAALERYRTFMARILTRSLVSSGRLRVREIGNALKAISGDVVGGEVVSSENNPLSIISVDVRGNVFTYSPELLDTKDSSGRTFEIGHVSSIRFERLFAQERFRKLNAEIRAGVAKCKETCSYFSVCGGGAPANKLAENGTFDSAETLFCTYKKLNIDVVSEHVVRKQLDRRDRSAEKARTARPPRHQSPYARMVPGIMVQRLRESRSGWLAISPGTESAHNISDLRQTYHDASRVPLQAWSEVDDEAYSSIPSLDRADSKDFVAIVQPSTSNIGSLREAIRASAGDPAGVRELNHRFSTLIEETCRDLLDEFGDRNGGNTNIGLALGPPNQVTTTKDHSSGLMIGLHLDSWSRSAANSRANAENRICVNLGDEPRFLMFVNLPLSSIIDVLQQEAVPLATLGPTEIGRRFMAHYPDYPVLRVRILPGEAYIAPTENVIHDGSTLGSQSADAFLTIRGSFRRPAPPR